MDELKGLKSVGEKGGNYMANALKESLLESISSDSKDLLSWVREHRLIKGKEVNLPPSQIEIYNDLSPDVVIQKGTQIFVSEYLVNLSLWAIDTKHGNRGNVLYTMPTQLLMDDFSQSRIDKAIEESPYLRQRFERSMSNNQTNRARLKRLSGSSLHMRGSDSLKQMISIDADVVIDDEVDWFSEETIEWSKERLGSAELPLFRAVSKPTYPEQGINLMFNQSDQREWHVKCEHCNRWQQIDWEKNIVFGLDEDNVSVNSVKVLCSNTKCRRDLNRLSDGEWVAAKPGRRVHGYHLSRLLSPLADLRDMAEDSIKVSDIPKIQRFYNSGLGLAYAPRGGKLTPSDLFIDSSISLHHADQGYGGVDVGTKLHAVVIEKGADRWDLCKAEEFDTFEQLDHWFVMNNLRACVIDARGDPRATNEWTEKYPGRVYRWSHIESVNDVRFIEDTQEIKYNRTSLLDNMYVAIREARIGFPPEIRNVPGFVQHLVALVRELVKDLRHNKLIPRYVGAAVDHYAFALAYALLSAGEDTASPAPMAVEKTDLTFAGQRSSVGSWTGVGQSRGWRNV